MILTTTDDSAATGIEVAYSVDDGATFTVLSGLLTLTSTVYTIVAGKVPKCTHLRLRNSSSTTLTGSRIMLAGVHA